MYVILVVLLSLKMYGKVSYYIIKINFYLTYFFSIQKY